MSFRSGVDRSSVDESRLERQLERSSETEQVRSAIATAPDKLARLERLLTRLQRPSRPPQRVRARSSGQFQRPDGAEAGSADQFECPNGADWANSGGLFWVSGRFRSTQRGRGLERTIRVPWGGRASSNGRNVGSCFVSCSHADQWSFGRSRFVHLLWGGVDVHYTCRRYESHSVIYMVIPRWKLWVVFFQTGDGLSSCFRNRDIRDWDQLISHF